MTRKWHLDNYIYHLQHIRRVIPRDEPDVKPNKSARRHGRGNK